MEKLFVVSFYAGECRVIEYASEDGTRYRAPTKDWGLVAEPVRTVVDGMVASAKDGVPHGHVGRWLYVQGVYEFWAKSSEVAEAVAATVGFASVFASSALRNPRIL
jgi:hypothetical protein